MIGRKLISVLSVAGLLTLGLSTAEGLAGADDMTSLRVNNGRYIGLILNFLRSYYFLSSLLWSFWYPAVHAKESRYHTAYACEGRQLKISCEQPNTIIHLLRANYGRFSISICNEHGNLDWSVDCTSAASFLVIKQTCEMKNNCSLSASPTLFGDPCPGTPKYLEAHYLCVPEKSSGTPVTSTVASTSSSTSTSRPPIIIPVTRNVRPYIPVMVTDNLFFSSSTTTTSTTTTTTQVVPSSSSPSFQPSPVGGRNWEERVTTLPPPPILNVNNSQPDIMVTRAYKDIFAGGASWTSTSEPSTVHLSRWSPGNSQEDEEPQIGVWCGPIMSRGLYWNWTRGGHIAVHRCPNGGIGRAKWRCDLLTVQWTPDAPDLSDCTSLWVDNIKYRISRGDSVTTLAAELAVITKTKTLMPGDIVHTADILHNLVVEMAERVRDIEDPLHRQRLLLALMETVLEVCSNLLEDSQRLPWHDLSQEQQQKSAAVLLRSQERSGWLLAESHHSRYSMQSGQPHVLAAVNVVESGDISDIVLPPPQDTWWLIEDRLLVPAPSLQATAKQGVSRVVLLVHNRLGDLLGTEIYPMENPDTNITRILNSRVIGALLEGHRVLSLPRPITVTFRHLQVENVSNPMCVFWDYQIRSWSAEGCWLKYSNRTHTVCQCNHLTNLAIIMHQSDSQDQPVSSDPLTLRMLVYIGCVVAILFLVVTILILQFVSLRTERVTIHKHLCLCLFLAEVVLIGGLEQTEEPRACSVLAGVLHYLLLAAFAWAFLDSFHLYILLGESEVQHDRWRVRWYTCVAYGIPLVVVAISALIDPASYGTETYCWLRVDNYYVFSFGGPAIACALASVLFLCLTVGRVCAQRNSTLQVKNKDQSKLSAVSKWSGEATILLLILCSTWTLLPLFLHRERPLTAYFFLALNSLQGLVVFIFYCIGGDKIPGAEEPPGPVWWCPCFKQTQRRRSHHHHHLYSPTSTNCQPHSVGTPLSPPPPHHLHHDHHHVHNLTTPPPCTQVVFPDRRCGGETCEEHPLQYLIRSPETTWRRHLDDERALCCYRSACGPSQHHHHHHNQQAPEPHYETLEPQEDSGVDLQPPRPLFSSLAAVLNNVGSVGHSGSSCASPCHVAYSGIQSPTDSDPSSSFDCHRMVSTPSSTGNDATDSLPDLDRRMMVAHPPIGIPASQTY